MKLNTRKCIKGAEQGNAKAQSHHPSTRSHVKDAEKVDADGFKQYLQAAKQGDSYAQCSLGLLYNSGCGGVKQNYVEASKWFRKAANQGLTEAQLRLGRAYIFGEGVVKNLKTAYGWLLLASVGGDNEASARVARLEKVLSTSQQQLAREWAIKKG